MPKRGKKGKSKGDVNVDREFVSAHHAAARGDYLFDSDDLGRRPRSMLLTQRPPRHLQDQIHWIEETFLTNLTLSVSGAVVENNIAVALTNLPGSSGIAALFDQYCIYSFMTRYCLEPSLATVVPGTYGRLHTAVDFDSVVSLGSEAYIQRFGSCMTSEIEQGKSYERFIKPTCAVLTGGSNSSSSTGVGMTRMWINNTFTTVPHFGIRYLTAGNASASAQNGTIFVTVIVGLRNNI
jgi:hypothetical protein